MPPPVMDLRLIETIMSKSTPRVRKEKIVPLRTSTIFSIVPLSSKEAYNDFGEIFINRRFACILTIYFI